MSTLAEYFLGSRSSVAQLDLLEISHPSFSKTYRLVRNAANGVTVTLETAEVAAFDYYPMSLTKAGAVGDLDYGIQVELGDLGEIVPMELDRVAAADTFETKPTVVARTYRSDDLSTPLVGPIRLEADAFASNGPSSAFTAKAPLLNIDKTGETYTIDRFPGLRGFL